MQLNASYREDLVGELRVSRDLNRGMNLLDNNTEQLGAVLGEEMKALGDAFTEVYNSFLYCDGELGVGKPPGKFMVADLLRDMARLQYALSGFAHTFGLPLHQAFYWLHDLRMHGGKEHTFITDLVPTPTNGSKLISPTDE